MIERSRQRVPMPVAAASIVIGLVAVVFVAPLMFAGVEGVLFGSMVALLFLAVAYGLWRGSGRARFWATLVAGLTLVSGVFEIRADPWIALPQIAVALLVFGLVRWPASSRRWVSRPAGDNVAPSRR